eukprot:s366_g68.t1
MTWKEGQKQYYLKESAERHVWNICQQGSDHAEGHILVYVDDMLLVGPMDLVKSTAGKISQTWQCSELETIEDKVVRFCGMELERYQRGIFLSQKGYTTELVKKHLVGERLWVSTRTRPDLTYAVGVLGRLAHKRPQYVT